MASYIYLGNFAAMDTVEPGGTGITHWADAVTLENPNAPVGVYDGSSLEMVDAQQISLEGIASSLTNDGAALAFLNTSGDQLSYTTSSGIPTTSTVDVTTAYLGTVYFQGGGSMTYDTTSTTSLLYLIQMTNGDVFLVPNDNSLDNQTISSISLTGNFDLVGGTVSAGLSSISASAELTNATIACFTSGTKISVPGGHKCVEDLQVGDLVQTVDNGLKPIRWIGSSRVTSDTLHRNEDLRPIRIRAGAVGHGLPESDLLVSPQHRILINSKIAKRMFGSEEVLVAAKQLVMLRGIDIARDMESVEYFHFLFDQHEVVFSNGAATESLFTGPTALEAVSPKAKEEILSLFPELNDVDYKALPARPIVNGRKGRRLAHRHKENKMSLTSGAALN